MFRTLLLLFVAGIASSHCFAHTPFEFLEVLKVSPANSIDHAVDLQSKFDTKRVETSLQGPELFARAVGCLGRPAKKTKAYLNWYRIASPKQEPNRRVTVLDLVRGSENMDLSIGKTEFFLSPAEKIESGPPDPVPSGVDHYTAYKVTDAADVKLPVEITGASSTEARDVAKPLFVCIATKEWHHDEFFDVSHPRACLVVYQLNSLKTDLRVNTLDQFSLNRLELHSSDWLCVRGTLLGSEQQ
jgi:hypothetical protein